jgi:ribosomal protein S27AE
MKSEKMICPDCGAEMNHHANKLDYSSAPDEGEAMNMGLGGVVQEAHTCPECGQTALRPAENE